MKTTVTFELNDSWETVPVVMLVELLLNHAYTDYEPDAALLVKTLAYLVGTLPGDNAAWLAIETDDRETVELLINRLREAADAIESHIPVQP